MNTWKLNTDMTTIQINYEQYSTRLTLTMTYTQSKLNCYYGCVFCSIPRLFVYLRMRMSTSNQSCGSASEPGYPLVSPVLRLHLCVSAALGTLAVWMMMIAFITFKSSLVPLFEGL